MIKNIILVVIFLLLSTNQIFGEVFDSNREIIRVVEMPNKWVSSFIFNASSYEIEKAIKIFFEAIEHLSDEDKTKWKKNIVKVINDINSIEPKNINFVAYDRLGTKFYILHYIITGKYGRYLRANIIINNSDEWKLYGYNYLYSLDEYLEKINKAKFYLAKPIDIPIKEHSNVSRVLPTKPRAEESSQ